MAKPVSIAGTADGPVPSGTKLSEGAAQWAKQRGISRTTLEALGVASGSVFFPDLGRKSEALFFKYGDDGWKARAYPEKAFVAKKGVALSFWNLANVLTAAAAVVCITEGELDACALVEAGIDAQKVLSVPGGASQRPTDDRPRGYGYVDDALKAGSMASIIADKQVSG
jgi:twinkle protein